MQTQHPYIVFSQEPKGLPDYERLKESATRFFASTVELLEQGDSSLLVRVTSARYAVAGELRIDARDTTDADLADARAAEVRGRAGGMAALAEKCRTVWQIGPAGADAPSEAAYLTFCAICASVALGPVMPADRSTLFGVRGSIERRDRIA